MNIPSSTATKSGDQITVSESGWKVVEQKEIKGGLTFVKLARDGKETWWTVAEHDGVTTLLEGPNLSSVNRMGSGSMVHQHLKPPSYAR